MDSLILRPYQQKAVDAMLDSYHSSDRDIISLPTGSGKSLVIADFVSKINTPVIITQPSREILFQNKKKLLAEVDKDDVGVYSASFNSKSIRKFTFVTIQSVYKKPELFQDFKVMIIDEAHGYKQGGMFDKFVKKINGIKVYGLTATPYRNETITTTNFYARTFETKVYRRLLTNLSFDRIIYSADTQDLIDEGYLSPLRYEDATINPADFSKNSEKKLVDSFSMQLSLAGLAPMTSIMERLDEFKRTIVFCPSVNIARILSGMTGHPYVSGETPKKERKEMLKDFKVIFNVGVLTTGFDQPDLDCIVLARPTQSLNLYSQIIGRGTRIAPGKTHCTVIDITGTCKKLGRLEDIRVSEIKEKLISTHKGDY